MSEAKLSDVLSCMTDHGCDAFFLAETGVMDGTHVTPQSDFDFDFCNAERALPGYGVGAIFRGRHRGRWARISTNLDYRNFGVWMLSISERPLLIGVLYAPHPGHGHEARSSVFSRVHESWVRLMAQYLPAVPVLLGDMNLPSFLSPNPSPGLAASESALNGLFHASFILQHGGVVLNPPAQATHIRGDILDLAMVFDCHQAFSCTVIPRRFANSDHFPIFVSSSLQTRPESATLKWCTYRDFPVEAYVAEVSPYLAVLHSWMAHRLRPVPQEECILKDILIQGSVAFGLLLLAALYQTNSPYGRFAYNNRRSRRRGFMSSALRKAIASMRDARGSARFSVLPQRYSCCSRFHCMTLFVMADTACLVSDNSRMFTAPACGYVDDIALLTSAPAAAQPALKVAFEWAKGIRMVFNVGVDKSACLVSYDGSAPTADMKFPDGQVLPVVDEYRYLGALLTATGRMGRTIQDLEERILQKTGPLIRWARANQIPLSHLGKLWKLYVEPGIWWLVAALPITHAQADRLDLLQRKVARMLLGHGKRSPLPSALACLGWVPWSHLLACARMSLLARACDDSCSLMAQLLPIAVSAPGTWAEQVSADVLHAFGIEAPHGFTASKADLKDFHSSCLQIGWQQLVEQCTVHPNLTHFPIEWFRGREIPNPVAVIFEAPTSAWSSQPLLYDCSVVARGFEQVMSSLRVPAVETAAYSAWETVPK